MERRDATEYEIKYLKNYLGFRYRLFQGLTFLMVGLGIALIAFTCLKLELSILIFLSMCIFLPGCLFYGAVILGKITRDFQLQSMIVKRNSIYTISGKYTVLDIGGGGEAGASIEQIGARVVVIPSKWSKYVNAGDQYTAEAYNDYTGSPEGSPYYVVSLNNDLSIDKEYRDKKRK
ncbi:MAG: hypothetical protein GY754_13470 [bacterium]|nr:hypothetical protein [bacterium]